MKERKRVIHAAVGMAIFFMALSLFSRPHNSPLPPVLRTFWFETHVAFSFFAYALSESLQFLQHDHGEAGTRDGDRAI